MATAGGPDIERNGLVFGMDTGYGIDTNNISSRFYPGKPTSNVLETEANWIYIGTEITDPTNYPVPLPKEVKFEKGAYNNGINWTDACRNYTDSYAAGTQITVSGWHMFYSTDTSLTMNGRNRLGWHYSKDGTSTYGGTIYTATEWNKWYYFSNTFSSTGTTTSLRVEDGGYDYYLSSEDAAKTTQYYCNLQVEVGTDIVSPYVKGTRSSTQSLIDLTKTTDIDVSNVSFDSTGQPTFDGTDDRISIPAGSFPTIGVNDFTVEVICKNTKTSSYNHFFSVKDQSHFALKMENAGSRRAYVYRTSGTSTYSAVPTYLTSTSNYYHLLVKREGDNLEMFLNGVSTGTKSGWDNLSIDNNAHTSYIGWGWGSEYTGGNIPLVKIYNRALSAQEVQQNYNSYKNRFNL